MLVVRGTLILILVLTIVRNFFPNSAPRKLPIENCTGIIARNIELAWGKAK